MTNPHSAAQRHLSRRDRILKRIIPLVGNCVLRPQIDLFAALVRSIIAQQISTKAAQSISARLIAGPCAGTLTPAALVAARDEDLRAAGLSAAKMRSLRDLAERVHSGTLRLDALGPLTDEEVIQQLVPVRGIGRWTAQMLLIFALGRPDVLPVDDFGLRAAAQRHYGLDELPGRPRLEELAAPWQPYRSIATWYMWRSLDPAIASQTG
ncbi:MAG: DNA-3-methyladenine glycosylase 2 family protein [Planctomycetes bacterium]|nr:DNA-3-methyladenine glycosylase 2 family protein [Planctomycetota bacterium]